MRRTTRMALATVAITAVTTINPIASPTANAAYPTCDSYLTANGARGKCLDNGTLKRFKVVLQCKNVSWNPTTRGDKIIVSSSWGYLGETRRVQCPGLDTTWDPIWSGIMTTGG